MKIRFFAALLIAALSIAILSGCAAAPAPVPPRTTPAAIPESTVPLAPAPQSAVPAPTEAPEVPVPTEAPAAPLPTEAPAAASRITKEEAIDIALKDAGFTKDQVTRLRAEFDYDDGRPEYEVDFHQDCYEYDYEIHAESGKLLSKDKDLDD